MKIFLTGATGYIGGSVAERLRREGHAITGLVRSESGAKEVETRGMRAVLGSLDDSAVIAHAAREADAVIDMAEANHPGVVEAIASGSGAFLHGFTYNAHPISLAAGRAVLRTLRSQNLVQAANCEREDTVASKLHKSLNELRNLKNVFSTAWRNQLRFCQKAVKCGKYIFITGFCSHFFALKIGFQTQNQKHSCSAKIAPNKACRRTVCHVPFRGIFSLENIFPFRWLVLVATRPLTQTVRRWLFHQAF